MKLYNFTSISSIVSNILLIISLIIQFYLNLVLSSTPPQDLSGACVLRSVCTRCIVLLSQIPRGYPHQPKNFTLEQNEKKKKIDDRKSYLIR